jgi:hypothetical protein
VEKISLAVNNYFASLESGAAEGEIPAEGVTVEGEVAEEAGLDAAAEAVDGEVAAEEQSAAPEATAEAEAASGKDKDKDEEHEPKDGSAPETTE